MTTSMESLSRCAIAAGSIAVLVSCQSERLLGGGGARDQAKVLGVLASTPSSALSTEYTQGGQVYRLSRAEASVRPDAEATTLTSLFGIGTIVPNPVATAQGDGEFYTPSTLELNRPGIAGGSNVERLGPWTNEPGILLR